MLKSSTSFAAYLRYSTSGFAVLLLILMAIAWQPYVRIDLLTGDPAAIEDFPLYFGVLSHVGVLMWAMGASICLFSAMLLDLWQTNADSSRFLRVFGWLSLLMCLDDLFLLHERVFPVMFRDSQEAVLFSYAVMIIVLIWTFRKIIVRYQPLFFVISLCLFSFSVFIDLIPSEITNSLLSMVFQSKFNGIRFLLEDGPKLLGIFSWLSYFAWVSVVSLTDAKETSIYPT